MKPKLIVPMSNRTNYSKIRPVLLELSKSDTVDLRIVLSSGILLDQYGSGHKDILLDGFTISHRIDCLLNNDTLESMSKTFGLSAIEHSTLLALEHPDGILVTGDRFDILGPVLAAKMMNIPIFHIQGGEISGSIDDTVRNIITLCSSRHYVATDNALDRVKAFVTDSESVMNFGCPAVEMISGLEFVEPCYQNYFLIALHPNTTAKDDVDMNVILQVCQSFGKTCIVFHPNPDAFNKHILTAIKSNPLCKLMTHVPIKEFVGLMARADCMIGNSSAGIREASSFGTPVVNVGNRQLYRERNTNTIDVQCDKDEIMSAINRSLAIRRYGNANIYFKPHSALNIAGDITRCLGVV